MLALVQKGFQPAQLLVQNPNGFLARVLMMVVLVVIQFRVYGKDHSV